MKSPNANFFFFVGSYFEIVITIAVFFSQYVPIAARQLISPRLWVWVGKFFRCGHLATLEKKYFYGEPGNAQLDPEVQISRALLGQPLGHSFP